MRVLLVTHVTESEYGGMADRVRGISNALRALGYDLDVMQLPITKRLWSQRFAPWWYFRPTLAWRRAMIEALHEHELVVASYLPIAHAVCRAVAGVEAATVLVTQRLVYDAHNDEARLARMSRPLHERRQVSAMENEVFKLAASVWVAGELDQKTLSARYPRARIVNVPNGVESLPDLVDLSLNRGEAFVYGSWTYKPNADGLFALASVSTNVVGRVRVFGSVPADLERRISRAVTRQPNISWSFEGFVPDLAGLAAAGGVAMVPVWSGGGTKLRSVQLLGMGVPSVVTEEALSGLPSWLADYVTVVETPAEMLSAALQALPPSSEKRREGRTRLLSELAWTSVVGRGVKDLECLT